MKKIILAAAAMLAAVCSYAQNTTKFGILGGVTFPQTELKKIDGESLNAVDQYHAGITLQIPVGTRGFAIQPSVLYNVKGATVEKQKAGELEFDTKTGYVELAAQLQYGISIGGLVRPYVFVEPYLGYSLNSEQTENALVNFDSNKLEWGAGAGAGVQILDFIQIYGRYVWNLGLAGNANFEAIKDIKVSSANGIQVSLAILF